VFLELLIDPACSVVFEAEPIGAEVMRQPPRRAQERLFDRQTVGLSLLQGLSVLTIVLAVFGVSLYRGQGELEARALTFTTLVVANIGLIFTNRSWAHPILTTLRWPNAALWGITSGALGALALVLYVPFLQELFRLAVLHPEDLALCLAGGLAGILWFEGLKLVKPGLGR
jgi:Ca2+-transporting ATPase